MVSNKISSVCCLITKSFHSRMDFRKFNISDLAWVRNNSNLSKILMVDLKNNV